MAQTGDPQPVTIRLQPEALGEVRVVLHLHRGQLRVSLAASGDAHRALVEGTPELRRLLESVGGADACIVVRDLPAAPRRGNRTRPDRSGPATRPAAAPEPDDPARTGPPPRTDAPPPRTAPPTRRARRVEPNGVTRARTPGLDVTM